MLRSLAKYLNRQLHTCRTIYLSVSPVPSEQWLRLSIKTTTHCLNAVLVLMYSTEFGSTHCWNFRLQLTIHLTNLLLGVSGRIGGTFRIKATLFNATDTQINIIQCGVRICKAPDKFGLVGEKGYLLDTVQSVGLQSKY